MHRFSRSPLAVLGAALALALPAEHARATADGPDLFRVAGVSSDDVLWIRSGPSTRYRKIGSIPFNGAGIKNLGCARRWCRVRYRGVTGYASQRYLFE